VGRKRAFLIIILIISLFISGSSVFARIVSQSTLVIHAYVEAHTYFEYCPECGDYHLYSNVHDTYTEVSQDNDMMLLSVVAL
jgi:hypothetical protein